MRLRTRRRREGKETGRRFLRRPAASFDPSLIIVVSIELIATLALARRLFDRSRFFNPLLVSLPLPSSHVHATLSCTRRCSSDDFSPCRANRGSVTWDHVSRFTKKSGSSSRAREERFLLRGRLLDYLYVIPCTVLRYSM